MRVLNICCDDWANFSHNIAKSLRSVGVDCNDVKMNKHIHNYDTQSIVMDRIDICKIVDKYDIIQLVHNNYRLFQSYYPYSKNKKHIVYYTGSDYRNNYKFLNEYFNQFVDASVICLGEFYNHCPKNMKYFIGGTELIPEFKKLKYPLTIAHFPSNSDVKGTTKINKLMSEINDNRFNYITDIINLSYKEHISRLRNCDIYIELYNSEINGNKYGSWGLTAMEAASLGKIVITMNLSDDVYKKYYGSHELQLFKDDDTFKQLINKLLNKSLIELEAMQMNSYMWVNEKHSLVASGKYLTNIIYGL